jgi:hypothetical protein
MERRGVDDVVSHSPLHADLFAEKALEALTVVLSPAKGDVVSLGRSSVPNEYTRSIAQQDTEERNLA